MSIRKGLFAQLGDVGTAYTDNKDAVEYRWALAELDDLVISNEDSGAINSRYPQELQPRDRSTAGSQAQVNDIAKNANFDRLSFSESVGNGAPIVGPNDGVAESGNGRLMGLRRAYDQGLPSIKAYREKLAANAGRLGLDGSKVAAMKKPVLVRVRQTTLDRRRFAEVANVSNVAPMREMEIARKDAANLSPELFDLFNPAEDGNIFTAGNQDFIRAFIRNVVPQSERPAIIDSRGGLSQSGLRRIRNALFVSAYGDSPEAMNALGRMAEDIEADGRNITNALIAAAPVFARQNAAIKNGALHDAGITGDIVAAAQALMEVRARGERVSDYLNQGQLIGDGVTPFQREILQFLDRNGRSAKRILETLRRYATALDAAGDPRQASLLDLDAPSKEGMWRLAQSSILSSSERPNLLAPNGKPSGLNARQWEQVRTPEFKRWFGDWLKLSHQRFLTGSSIAEIQSSIAPQGGFAELRNWAASVFRSQGGMAVNQELSEVILNERSVRDSIAHGGANRYKRAAFAVVKDVIEQGRVLLENQRDSQKSFYISAPVKIDGVDDIVTALVRRDANAQRMYLHSVTTKESLLTAGVSTAPTQGKLDGSLQPEGTKKILQDIFSVNPDSVSKVRDENGEPMVVWHNSGSRFDTFDLGMARTSSDIQAFFFKDGKDPYDEYGPVAYPVFLNLRNPANYKQAVSGFDPASTDDAGVKQREKLQGQGFDGFWMTREEGGLDYAELGVFSPYQIKSAEPATYDDAGNPIPQEVRFNPQSQDIRYSYAGQKMGSVAPDLPAEKATAPLARKDIPNAEIATNAQHIFETWPPTVQAADGATIALRVPEHNSMAARVWHLISREQRQSIDPQKAVWMPIIPETLQNAQVRLIDGQTGNRVYARKYDQGIIHAVVVNPTGEMVEQQIKTGFLVTAFPIQDIKSADNRTKFMAVEWARVDIENENGLRQNAPKPTPRYSMVSGPRNAGFQDDNTQTQESRQDEAVDFSKDERFRHLFYGAPTQEQVGEFQKWLKANPDQKIRLYHGTSSLNPVQESGLLKTTANRRNSFQSSSGFVYLSVYPGLAKNFGRYAALNRGALPTGEKHALYHVDLRVSELFPDKDQLSNQRAARADYGVREGEPQEIGNTLAESLIFGRGARFKGNIPVQRVVLSEHYSRGQDPSRWEGRSVFDKEGNLLRIELNPANLHSEADVKRVLEHELAHAATEKGHLADVTEQITEEERSQIAADMERLGYDAADSKEADARDVDALVAAWRGRSWFEKATAHMLRLAKGLGLNLSAAQTRLLAERAAARAIAEALRKVRGWDREPGSGADATRESRAQAFFDFGFYQNPGELDFRDRGKAPGDLVKENLGLATAIALDYQNIPGVELHDVTQQARVALVKAARGYDGARGVAFGTYAGRAMRNTLNSLFNRQNHIADVGGISFDAPLSYKEDTLHDLIPEQSDQALPVEQRETGDIVAALVDSLPERPRAIVRGFMAGRIGGDMAEELGITRQAVNASLRGAMAVTRQRLRERGFEGQEDGILFSGERAMGKEGTVPEDERAGQESSASTPPGQGADKKQVSNSGVLPYAYLDGNDSLQKAHDRFGGPQGLLRGAAQILGNSPSAAYKGNDPKAAGYDEIRELTRFAREAGLLMDADKVRAYFSKNPMRGGSEHKVAHDIVSERVIKDLNAHAIATESLFDYLADLELSNYFFGDGIHLDGFHELDGKLHIITSQPFRRGIHPEPNILKDALEEQGLESESPTGSAGVFTIHDERAGDISVIDIKPDNVIWDEATGIAWIIDAHFYFDSHGDRVRALEQLGLRDPEFVRPEDGTLSFGERTPGDDLNDLFAELNRELPSQAEIDALRQKAHAEPKGQRTIGKPRKANYAQDDPTRVEINVVQDMREEARKREEENARIAEARKRIETNKDLVKKLILEKALNPAKFGTFTAVGDANAASFGELRHLFRGAMPGIVKGWQAGVRAWGAENDFFESEKLNQQIMFEGYDKAGDIKVTIPGKAGRVIRIPGRVLMFMDSFFQIRHGPDGSRCPGLPDWQGPRLGRSGVGGFHPGGNQPARQHVVAASG